jgi:hypothetical protein
VEGKEKYKRYDIDPEIPGEYVALYLLNNIQEYVETYQGVVRRTIESKNYPYFSEFIETNKGKDLKTSMVGALYVQTIQFLEQHLRGIGIDDLLDGYNEWKNNQKPSMIDMLREKLSPEMRKLFDEQAITKQQLK